jgi:hypothetical protein
LPIKVQDVKKRLKARPGVAVGGAAPHVMRARPAQALARRNGPGEPGRSPSRPLTTGLQTTPIADWRHHRLPAPTPGP